MILWSLLMCLALGAEDAGNLEKRQAYLDELREMLPRSRPWEQWLEESGELPPDFDAMPAYAPLPDPLVRMVDGKPVAVTSAAEWQAQREVLLEPFHRWILGSVPPPPDNLVAKVLVEHEEAGATVRKVELRFGPEGKAKLWLELFLPKGSGPFPVFMTQENHRVWALIALRRGYAACIYAGCDSRDDTDTFLDAYPKHDWSRLTRRAWAAGRCIDYLETVPQADAKKVALTGHSRNGKLSLIASAIDERIAVVISSSSGTGGSLASRYCGEHHFAEGIENITRNFPDWFHPRWRFFSGREHLVPIDLHQLVALSAPRACLLSIALNDTVESTWAMERTYLSVKPVYELLGVEDRLAILRRAGGHETWPTTIERYIDWCDLQFGRGTYEFPERLIHPWDWEAWRRGAGPDLDPMAFPRRPFGATHPSRQALREAVLDMLGTAPPVAASPRGSYGTEKAHVAQLLRRNEAGNKIERDDLTFGDYVNADVYMPEGTQESGAKLPVLLWLHPISNPTGYMASYRRGEQFCTTAARDGFAVFCYDQIGFGRRIEEVEDFYTRYPKWSLLGHMVRDAQAALDVLVALPYVDREQVYVVGYHLGALVAMHLAALDERPTGYALVSAPPPYRLDTNEALTGGIHRWAKLHMLLPRLGFFLGQEEHVPYDLDELLGAMAPRPVLINSPRLDRSTPLALATESVESARKTFSAAGAEGQLAQEVPDAYNHFDTGMQRVVLRWLRETAKIE